MCQTSGSHRRQDTFSYENLERHRNETHSRCIACSPQNLLGLKLAFKLSEDGAITGQFFPGEVLQGYDGFIHGGVIATMLDACMTNCLFAHDHVALTAELVVRYRKPVLVNEMICLRAWIENDSTLLYCMRAELTQNNELKAIAKAKFLNKQ